MKSGNILKKTSDTLRSAPLGFSLVAMNLVNPVIIAAEFHVDASDAVTIPVSAVGLFFSGALVARQLVLGNKLEATAERRGFSERVMSETTDEWCNRQTARVVCENNGALDQYIELCDSRRESAQLKFIPHI